jgi:hypothetical protein
VMSIAVQSGDPGFVVMTKSGRYSGGLARRACA